jgi:hypothetical protein
MALSQQHRSTQRQSWLQGGSLFVVISLGLHWAVLQMPLPEPPEPDLRVTLESSPEPTAAPTATMDVVRLPLPEPTTNPTNPSPSLSLAPQPPLLAQTSRATPKPQVPPVVATTPSPETMVLPPQAPIPDPQTPAAIQPPEAPQTLATSPTPDAPQGPTEHPPVPEPPSAPPAFQYNGQAKAVETSEIGMSLWYYDQPWSLDYPLHPTELLPLTVTYSETTCLSPEPVAGLLVVFLNPDGSFTEPGGVIGANPLLVSSTGYDELDEQALTAAQTYDATDSLSADVQIPKGYALEVEVEYNPQTCTPADASGAGL